MLIKLRRLFIMIKKILLGISTFALSVMGGIAAFAEEAAATAAAEATAEATTGTKTSGLNQWVVIAIYVVILGALFYFLIFRPQKKRQKEEQELKSSLCLGQQITTIGGIVGTIVSIKDDEITIQTSIDNTLMTFKNWAIREIKKVEKAD